MSILTRGIKGTPFRGRFFSSGALSSLPHFFFAFWVPVGESYIHLSCSSLVNNLIFFTTIISLYRFKRNFQLFLFHFVYDPKPYDHHALLYRLLRRHRYCSSRDCHVYASPVRTLIHLQFNIVPLILLITIVLIVTPTFAASILLSNKTQPDYKVEV